jgi:peptidoglycan/xylan/chitin deacetylase (PgdA/CDA1 family)
MLRRLFRWAAGLGTAYMAVHEMRINALFMVRPTVLAVLALAFVIGGYFVLDRRRVSAIWATGLDVLISTLLVATALTGLRGWPVDLRPLLQPELDSYGQFDTVAAIDRSLWPYKLDSPAAFDAASRAEILSFTIAIAEHESSGRGPSGPAVEKWLAIIKPRVRANFDQACATCTPGAPFCPRDPANDWSGLVSFAREATSTLRADLAPWRKGSQAFHTAYLTERLRLAAVPISSEAFALDDSEITGDGFPDRSFLVTLDDGPTAPEGTTDQTLDVVRKNGKSALVFLVGSNLQKRLGQTPAEALRAVYGGSCIGGHGMEHLRHSEWPEAATSLPALRKELERIGPGDARPLFFRPPFGDRSTAIVSALGANGFRDMMWNIDSRDWRPDVDGRAAAARSLTLMLVARRGIILFHDVHPKAKEALPILWSGLEGSGVRWLQCRDLDPANASGLSAGS